MIFSENSAFVFKFCVFYSKLATKPKIDECLTKFFYFVFYKNKY